MIDWVKARYTDFNKHKYIYIVVDDVPCYVDYISFGKDKCFIGKYIRRQQ
jgi:hypothetical protein